MVFTSLQLQSCFFGWYGRSLQDIQACLDALAGNKTITSTGAADQNSGRAYMYDMLYSHIWRNNSNAPCTLTFYKLTPRGDVPSFVSGNITPAMAITPPSTYNYGDCLIQDPVAWTQPFADMIPAIAGNGFASSNLGSTPYMNPVLTGKFKIKRIKVNRMGMKVHTTILKPGEEINLTTKALKPFGCWFNKFYLAADNSKNISQIWEALRATPILMIQAHGDIVHETGAPGNIATGKLWIDYMVRRKGRFVFTQTKGTRLYRPWANAPVFVGAPELHEDITAATEAEVDT